MPTLQPGDRLGAYAIVATLGAGGLADVYRGRDTRSGAKVALKVLDAVRRAENPGLRDRMLREAAALESLAGVPGVVGLVERFTDDARGADVLVLELIEGRDLASFVGDRSTPIRSLVEWMGHACHVFHPIQETGWVHRDLKPENLILVDGADPPIRIIDFNSAAPSADASAGRLTRAQGTFPFTPAYLAPECFDGALPDRSADVYALGLTFAEVVLGAHPLLDPGTSDLATREQWWDAHRLRALPDLASARPDAPPALRRALVRATAKDPAERLPDALALWEALREAWSEIDSPPAPTREAIPEFQGGPESADEVTDAVADSWQPRGNWVWRALAGVVLGGLSVGVCASGGVSMPAAVLAWRDPEGASADPLQQPADQPVSEPAGSVSGPAGTVRIPAGTFQMGSDSGDADEKPVHTVSVGAFLLMEHEVTQAEYAAVMGSNPSKAEYEGVSLLGDRLPVQHVSWCDAVSYANALSQRDGLRPAYGGVEGCSGSTGTTVTWDRSADGWRLPTEAEWEYAARGGGRGRWSGTDDESSLCRVANVADAIASRTTASCTDGYKGLAPVGSFAANGYGLHDMSGNVWEWVWDWYDANYYSWSSSELDPTGPSFASQRVVRGGSWGFSPAYARVALRYRYEPGYRYNGLGFRLARPAP